MYQQRIVIVGAGIVGLSTAYALLQEGMQHVTVLEQATVNHPLGASHGLSRLLRFEYGNDLFYSKMVQLSLQRWRRLEHTVNRTLYTSTGLLVLGDDSCTMSNYHVLHELGVSPERLSRSQTQQRFPQFDLSRYSLFTYNRESGILHASSCLLALKKAILALGGSILEGIQVTQIDHAAQHSPIRLHSKSGEEILADKIVVAVGSWIHRILGDLRLPIRTTRQYLLYFDNLPIPSFQLNTFPAFMVDDLYGFPIHTSSENGPAWFKAASHTFGVPVEPDDDPLIDEEVIAQITEKLRSLLPSLANAKLAHVDACMYDVSPDEDFILDYMPSDSRIVLAAGLTGHGFKFGPLLGDLLASLVLHTKPIVPLDRFRLARFEPAICL